MSVDQYGSGFSIFTYSTLHTGRNAHYLWIIPCVEMSTLISVSLSLPLSLQVIVVAKLGHDKLFLEKLVTADTCLKGPSLRFIKSRHSPKQTPWRVKNHSRLCLISNFKPVYWKKKEIINYCSTQHVFPYFI